jgi:hypothetical protein
MSAAKSIPSTDQYIMIEDGNVLHAPRRTKAGGELPIFVMDDLYGARHNPDEGDEREAYRMLTQAREIGAQGAIDYLSDWLYEYLDDHVIDPIMRNAWRKDGYAAPEAEIARVREIREQVIALGEVYASGTAVERCDEYLAEFA